MSNSGFGWESLLHTDAPPGCALKTALFTTYERPSERLLVEHLLPLLLRLSREPDGEGAERQYFLLELDRRLKQLHDKLVVISSTVREEPADEDEGGGGDYGWIWRNIRPLTVGSRRRAVQHAKLWLLHWGASDDGGSEHLEIVVSSANLTMSAFKGQVQAAWRACIELEPRPAAARLAGWGVLPEFMRELASSAGAMERLRPFIALLARAVCPSGVSFVASVPGTFSRKDLRRLPWGAAGLRGVMPPGKGSVTASILSPYVGSWSVAALRRWCTRFEGLPDRVELVWIDKHHPWARAKRWILPKASLTALDEAGATVRLLRHAADDPEATDSFHEEHRTADDRWSHAKVYVLRRGISRRVLVTSANFSTSAWGSEGSTGDLTIENFELGVCLEQADWPFDHLVNMENVKDAATVAAAPGRLINAMSWAQAVWDGKHVTVECRAEVGCVLEARIRTGEVWTTVPSWNVAVDGRLRSARVPWQLAKEVPSVVRLTCGEEALTVPIFDTRPVSNREVSMPPEVDGSAAQTMSDQLLFEQYGGRVASVGGDDVEDEPPGPDAENSSGEGEGNDDGDDENLGGRHLDSYAVEAFVLARQRLRVVDNWAERVKRMAMNHTAALERQWLVRDGELLVEAFKRQAARDRLRASDAALGATMAGEELALRLKHLPEE